MNKKIYKIIVTVVFILVLSFDLLYLISFKMNKKEIKRFYATNKNIAKMLYENELKMINPELEVVSLFGDTLKLYSVLNNRYTLIIKISDTDCNTCLKYLLELFKQYASNFDTEEIIFLVNAANLREVISLKSANDLNFPVFMLLSKLGLPAEDLNKPILFLLNNEFQINMISYADAANPEILRSFFNNLLKSKIFNQNI